MWRVCLARLDPQVIAHKKDKGFQMAPTAQWCGTAKHLQGCVVWQRVGRGWPPADSQTATARKKAVPPLDSSGRGDTRRVRPAWRAPCCPGSAAPARGGTRCGRSPAGRRGWCRPARPAGRPPRGRLARRSRGAAACGAGVGPRTRFPRSDGCGSALGGPSHRCYLRPTLPADDRAPATASWGWLTRGGGVLSDGGWKGISRRESAQKWALPAPLNLTGRHLSRSGLHPLPRCQRGIEMTECPRGSAGKDLQMRECIPYIFMCFMCLLYFYMFMCMIVSVFTRAIIAFHSRRERHTP